MDWIYDLRLAGRRLAETPGFTLAAALTLALGIGSNTAIFSLVQAVILSPLPYPESDRLVELWHEAPGADIDRLGLSYGTYLHYLELNQTFDVIAAYQTATLNLTGNDDEPQRTEVAYVTSSFFDLFASPRIGRGISGRDDVPGADGVVVMSHRLWRERYGSQQDILDRSILLDGLAFRVVGVMPPDFDVPTRQTDLWLPVQLDPARVSLGGFSPLGIGRLKPGVSVEQARADLVSLVPRLGERFPGRSFQMIVHNAGLSPRLTLLKEQMVGDVRPMLWILLGSVGVVLLMACVNVANLFLARTESRRREVAVRTALGASRGRLVAHSLSESLLLAFIGGTLGLLLAFVGIEALVRLGPASIPRLEEVGLNTQVLTFTAIVSILAGIGFGAIPVMQLGGSTLMPSLKDSGRTFGFRGQGHRNALVVAQVALALVLLIAAGLMVRSFWQLKQLDPGFDAEGVLTFRVSLPTVDYPDRETAARFQQEVTEQLGKLPGAQAVGAVSCLPLTGCRNVAHVMREDTPLEPGAMPPPAQIREVAAGYFRSMGIPLLEGRSLTRADQEDRTGAVMVNRSLAEHFWPNQSAIGKLLYPGVEESPPWYKVVGVVGDVPTRGLTELPEEVLYLPLLGRDAAHPVPRSMVFTVKTAGHPEALARPAQELIWSLDPNLPLANLRSMGSLLAAAQAPMAFALVLLAIAGIVALTLGAVGVYGVLSYMVSRCRNEIGVRMALGASCGQVRRMVLGRGTGMVVVGVSLGWIGALALTQWMRSILYNVQPHDPPTYVAVSMMLVAVAILASYLPARRASLQDPTETLRDE